MPRLLEPNYTEMNTFVNAPALAMYTLTPNQNTHTRIHVMATANKYSVHKDQFDLIDWLCVLLGRKPSKLKLG